MTVAWIPKTLTCRVRISVSVRSAILTVPNTQPRIHNCREADVLQTETGEVVVSFLPR